MNTYMDKIVYYENILEFKENTQSQLQYDEVKNWNLCRTCLQETQNNDTDFSGSGICLMGMDGELLNVRNMLTSVTGLQISDDDRLPAKICKICLSKISALHFFKLQTQRAEIILQRMRAKLDEIENSNENSKTSQKAPPDITINEADCSSNNGIERKKLPESETNFEHGSQDAELPETDNDFEIKNTEDDLKTLKSENVIHEENNESEESVDLPEVFYEDNKEDNEEYVYEELQADGDEMEGNVIVDTTVYSLDIKSEEVCPVDGYNEEENQHANNVEEKIPHRKRNKGKVLLSDLTCVICNKSFPQQQLLITHVSEAHPNTKAFKCRTCGHMFSHLQSLSRHMQTHLEIKLKKFCNECGKSFLRSDD